MTQTTLSVAAIKNGTVIDHISADSVLKILHFLDLPIGKYPITIGINLPSKKIQHKGLIKIENKELTAEEINQIALFSPDTTINIIHDYTVVKKYQVEIPPSIKNIVICPNPTCITQHEKMETHFVLKKKKEGVHLQCFYCEKIFSKEEISLK